jgi:hypothetical protein
VSFKALTLTTERLFRFDFARPGLPLGVVLWTELKHSRPRLFELGNGHQTVHIRWPVGDLEGHGRTDERVLSGEIAEVLRKRLKQRRAPEEIDAFENALLTWLTERRGESSSR